MSQAFHDFLVWFDGWSENIDEQPTAKQWERLKAKLSEIRSATPVMVAAPAYAAPPAEAAPVAPPKPMTERQWRSQFIGALVETGYDLESAEEMLSGYAAKTTIDIASDPKAAAAAVHNTAMN